MISTHILDTHLGKPASDVVVRLYDQNNSLLAESKTNVDGRVADFQIPKFEIGQFSLEFETAEYFHRVNTNTFFPKAVIHFYINDLDQHYHIPLLISPFAYSTYRGS
jgi:5-hydroxyisourate hydrolase